MWWTREIRAWREFDLPGWEVSDFQIETEDVRYDTTFGDPSVTSPETYRRIVASFVMKREAPALFLKLISGAYIAFAAAMMACLMKTTQPPVFSGRMGLQIACLFAAIINNRSTDASLGRDDLFTLPDLLHILIYAMIFCAMLITLRSRVLVETKREQRAILMERKATIALAVFFVVANIILIWRAAVSPIQLA